MKTILRNFLINLGSLWVTSQILPGLVFQGGLKTLAIAAAVFMVINILIVPLLRIMFLPLNLLTLGFFSFAVNVLALYILTAAVPQFKIIPYYFPGTFINGIVIPSMELSVLYVAILASFMIGFATHLLQWLTKH